MTASALEGHLHHGGGRYTWYNRVQPLRPRHDALPLIVLHGGPGMAHDYLRRLENLTQDGREVIFYDQIGCGLSSHHPDAHPSTWQVEVFVDELDALVKHWDLQSGFHLLGQSWGGMLAPEFALAHPEAPIATLSLLNSPASMPAWAAGVRLLLKQMPTNVQESVTHHETDGTFDDPRYKDAVTAFYGRHLCRLEPLPRDMEASFEQLEADPSVYSAMIGPSEFTITGTLSDWTVEERLGDIKIPTLVGYGEHDEATDSWIAFATNINGARIHRFDGASHTPHLEKPTEFDDILSGFLRENDPPV